MSTDVQFKSFNPWLSIWVKPRKTIQWIVETDPTQQVILLAILGGIGGSLDLSEATLSRILFWAVIYGSISGLIQLYLGGIILRWVGGWFGGQASTQEVRAAIAWSQVPMICSLLLWILALILIVFSEIFIGRFNMLVIFGLVAGRLIAGLWAFIIFLKCLGEVHRFSVWRALGTVFIPGFVLIGIVSVLTIGLDNL